jgi:hypothetical protein
MIYCHPSDGDGPKLEETPGTEAPIFFLPRIAIRFVTR